MTFHLRNVCFFHLKTASILYWGKWSVKDDDGEDDPWWWLTHNKSNQGLQLKIHTHLTGSCN